MEKGRVAGKMDGWEELITEEGILGRRVVMP